MVNAELILTLKVALEFPLTKLMVVAGTISTFELIVESEMLITMLRSLRIGRSKLISISLDQVPGNISIG
jgi:hypothetical protein